jgi:hypothetical protein
MRKTNYDVVFSFANPNHDEVAKYVHPLLPLSSHATLLVTRIISLAQIINLTTIFHAN